MQEQKQTGGERGEKKKQEEDRWGGVRRYWNR